nr:MAG TPA: hypothetical protein [Caudoviricetes sp.]
MFAAYLGIATGCRWATPRLVFQSKVVVCLNRQFGCPSGGFQHRLCDDGTMYSYTILRGILLHACHDCFDKFSGVHLFILVTFSKPFQQFIITMAIGS